MIVRIARLLVVPIMAVALQGCLAKTALDVATAPVKIGSKAVDLATTSQSEADEKRGREIRKREERLARLDRKLRDREDDCRKGDDEACREAVSVRGEMDELLPTIPVERDD